MPDRLSELVRQRALVLEHLAWLDREIASAKTQPAIPAVTPVLPSSMTSPASAISPPSEGPTAVPSAGSVTATQSMEMPTPETDVILDQYLMSTATVKQDVRKGCFLYFAAAFVVLGIVVAILYFTISSR